ncbi:MAG: hypothetical protein ACLR5G_06190 [Eubacteriales bacterium]
MKTSRFAFLLTAALSLTALSSCGGEKLPPKERVSNVYRATEIDLGMYDYTSEVMAYAGGIIVRATKVTDRETGTREQHLLRLSYDGKVQSDEIMPDLPEQTYLRQLVADQNGELFAVIANYDGNATVFSLCDYDGLAVGETIIEDIGALFVEEVESADRPWLNEFYLQGTAIDRDGNFIFASGTAVAAAGRDGKKLFSSAGRRVGRSGYRQRLSYSGREGLSLVSGLPELQPVCARDRRRGEEVRGSCRPAVRERDCQREVLFRRGA